jgi:large subunit ribosomal protein L22
MSTGVNAIRTNEVPGVRARLGDARFSAYKAREVLDLVRGEPVGEARNILELCERGAARPIVKLLDSAVANAANNNDIPPEELFVGACYADEGPTLKRWRPRARGRATRINKRTCHITIIVSRFTPEEMDERRARDERRGRTPTDARADRARRVARSRAAEEATEATDEVEAEELAEATAEADTEDAVVEQAAAEVEAVSDENDGEVTTDEAADTAAGSEDADEDPGAPGEDNTEETS